MLGPHHQIYPFTKSSLKFADKTTSKH
jgi:hypothetical protein